MKIVSVYFDYNNLQRYETLAKVLAYSVKKYCPLAEFKLFKIDRPILKAKHRSRCFTSNTYKLRKWLEVLKNTNDNVIFIDCDTIVLKDLFPAFFGNFDIGFMKRTSSRIKYNGGVVFVRNTPEAIEFIELWNKINEKMYNDYNFHRPYHIKYAGMNQAAFGYILENEKFKAKLKSFSCLEWDACDEDWQYLNNDTKIIHVKGNLRRAIFGNRSIYPFKRAIAIWNNLAVEAGVRSGKVEKINYHEIEGQTTHMELKPIINEMNKHPHLRKVKGLRRRQRV